MHIRIGYELTYECQQQTPINLVLNVHYTRVGDLCSPDHVITRSALTVNGYRDMYGNWCTRLVLPVGNSQISTDALIRDTGQPDIVNRAAQQTPIEELPADALPFLLGSRYCETDLLTPIAWKLWANGPTGWDRVQAICDFVHAHVTFGYAYA
ncbi:MAG TPA: transglutaminase family protein, partial [Polyangiaceae bacterium]|nr:transglutaminase family protein [Polyangiaceae bacterium]